jgi:hypothetical protein
MKTLETLRSEFQKLRDQKVPSGAAYKAFANKWKSLQSQIRNYDNDTNIMKRAGLKVRSTTIGYFVTYKGHEAHIFADACETTFWSTDVTKGDLELYTSRHDTKGDAVYSFFCEVNE